MKAKVCRRRRRPRVWLLLLQQVVPISAHLARLVLHFLDN